jgi:hypothetical protein
MTMTENELLTREIGLAERIDPTGRRWDVDLEVGGQSLYRVVLVNEEGESVVPRSYPGAAPELAGRWTNRTRGLQILDNYLTTAWDLSDRSGKRSVRDKHAAKVAAREGTTEELDIIAA